MSHPEHVMFWWCSCLFHSQCVFSLVLGRLTQSAAICKFSNQVVALQKQIWSCNFTGFPNLDEIHRVELLHCTSCYFRLILKSRHASVLSFNFPVPDGDYHFAFLNESIFNDASSFTPFQQLVPINFSSPRSWQQELNKHGLSDAFLYSCCSRVTMQCRQ